MPPVRCVLVLCAGLALTLSDVAKRDAVASNGADRRGSAPMTDSLAPGRVLVRLNTAAALVRFESELKQYPFVIEKTISHDPPRLLLSLNPRLTSGLTPGSTYSAAELAAVIGRLEHVRYAVAETVQAMELRARHVPNDPLFPAQWHLDDSSLGATDATDASGADINAPEAWEITRGSADIVIAVLDDGVDTAHPDLAPNVSPAGRNFTTRPPSDDPTPKSPDDRHGTSVAGVAAARADNGLGIAGVCPNCTILPIRVYRSSNVDTAAAFRYAIEQGADVITNSWGYAQASPSGADDAVQDAIEQAASEGRGGRGATVVFGMTNEAVDNCRAPLRDISSLPSVIAVGVADHNGEIGESGYGDCMDLVAPAKPRFRSTIGITTTDRQGLAGHTAGDYYTSFGGTSAAAPIVAGVAGLLLSLNPELTREEVQRILEHTADRIDQAHAQYNALGFSTRAGYGRVNAAQALRPTVRIAVTPSEVLVGEAFSVTISASAPFGVQGILWRGRGTPLDWRYEELDDGRSYYSRTWSGLALQSPGTFRFEAVVEDARHSESDSYPHSGVTPDDIVAGLLTVKAVTP